MINYERLKNLRKGKGLTQQDLADMIGASKSLICCYETGKRNPSLENIISFMHIFGVSADFLLGSDNLIKTVENGEEKYNYLTNDELKFIEELRNDKMIYDILLSDYKRGIKLIKNKLG